MKQDTQNIYVCPITQESLSLQITEIQNGNVITGQFISQPSGHSYSIVDGIPYFRQGVESSSVEVEANKALYEEKASIYDEGMQWLFASFYIDEQSLRREMVDRLELQPTYRVLEVGAGTCRDSVEIVKRLGPEGQLFLNDYSPRMLEIGRRRMEKAGISTTERCSVEYFVGDAAAIPFPDDYFDAAYHFGGVNLFDQKQKAIHEITRVVRPGGKVVFGDEGVAPWLRNSTYGKILINSNPLYTHTAPLELLPETAGEVQLRWVLGNAFYLIDFRVMDSLPPLDLDLPIPGERGGTHRTRYHGAIDGISPETKAQMQKAALEEGIDFHQWLERAVNTYLEQTKHKRTPPSS